MSENYDPPGPPGSGYSQPPPPNYYPPPPPGQYPPPPPGSYYPPPKKDQTPLIIFIILLFVCFSAAIIYLLVKKDEIF